MLRRSGLCALLVLIAAASPWGCGKKNGTGDVSASIMKSSTVSASLTGDSSPAANLTTTTATGSNSQSFTPTSMKLAIFNVNLCNGESSCTSIYSCSGSVAECSIELSKIDAFVAAVNGSAEIEAGQFFDHIGVSFCPEGDSSGQQHVTLNGTVAINGTSYGTHPTTGLVAGGTGEDTALAIQGGCASFYPLAPAITTSEDETIQVKIFFDVSDWAYGGLSGGAASANDYLGATSCAGDKDTYVCGQVITVVAAVDSGNPTTEHYLLTDTTAATGGSATSMPTGTAVLYFSSEGAPIGGVQSFFRVAGPDVSWGNRLGWGLGLYPKTVDVSTVSFGEPEGSVRLANWFKNFKRADHTGTYVYAASGGVATDGEYAATRF